jgi:cation-transporting ATPase 13A3/4/5
MAYTGAYKILAPELPPGSLVSVHVLSSIIGQIIIQAGVSVSAYLILIEQEWYESQDGTVEDVEPNAENTTLYLVSNLQFIYVCMAFSIGPPFRQPAYYNLWFIFTVVLLTANGVYLIFNPFSEVRDLLDLAYLNFGYRFMLFIVICLGGIFTFIYEKKIVIWLDKKWGS